MINDLIQRLDKSMLVLQENPDISKQTRKKLSNDGLLYAAFLSDIVEGRAQVDGLPAEQLYGAVGDFCQMIETELSQKKEG